MSEVTYVKAGSTPGWMDARVIDLDTGEQVQRVLEVDTHEGCLLRQARHPCGRPVIMDGEYQKELVLGRFAVEMRKP
jgi:hypothetical protein